jgi:hypothetical protein
MLAERDLGSVHEARGLNGTRQCCGLSLCQRVDDFQLREAGEIPVGGSENTHAVEKAEGGNPGIMNDRTV